MINLDFWSVILGFGVLNGLFLACILWFAKKGSVRSNRLLAAILLSISIFTLELIVYRVGYYLDDPTFSLISFPFVYLLAPLFYLYARSLIGDAHVFQKTNIVHLVAPLLAVVALIPYYFWTPEQKLDYLLQFVTPSGMTFRHLWLGGLFLLQTAVYILLTFRFLRNFERRYKKGASDTRIQHLEWLNKLMLAFLVFILCNAAISGFYLVAQFVEMPNIEQMIFPAVEVNMVTLTLFAHIVGYHAIINPNHLFPASAQPARYARSTLTTDQSQQYVLAAQKCMQQEQLYLNPDLNLASLADHVGVSPDHLSQVINSELSVNFYDFVNQYRVSEAQKRLLDPAFGSYSILGIALDSGFSSKSSFNRIFKKHVGITPSQFVANHKSK